MSREAFVETKFRKATLAVIEQANVVIAEYEAQGFTLTLRQLFYQLVASALIENKQTGVIFTSNHKTDGLFLPPDDRRHFVAWRG
jgi:hypothetical protein